MGCTNMLANNLCFECKDKKWIDGNKEYFCNRYDKPLSRLDGNSGGALRTLQCISGRGQRPKKVPSKT